MKAEHPAAKPHGCFVDPSYGQAAETPSHPVTNCFIRPSHGQDAEAAPSRCNQAAETAPPRCNYCGRPVRPPPFPLQGIFDLPRAPDPLPGRIDKRNNVVNGTNVRGLTEEGIEKLLNAGIVVTGYLLLVQPVPFDEGERAVHAMHKRFLDVLLSAVFSSFGLTFDSGYENLQRGATRNSYHDLFLKVSTGRGAVLKSVLIEWKRINSGDSVAKYRSIPK